MIARSSRYRVIVGGALAMGLAGVSSGHADTTVTGPSKTHTPPRGVRGDMLTPCEAEAVKTGVSAFWTCNHRRSAVPSEIEARRDVMRDAKTSSRKKSKSTAGALKPKSPEVSGSDNGAASASHGSNDSSAQQR